MDPRSKRMTEVVECPDCGMSTYWSRDDKGRRAFDVTDGRPTRKRHNQTCPRFKQETRGE
jgi:hypothetical protein